MAKAEITVIIEMGDLANALAVARALGYEDDLPNSQTPITAAFSRTLRAPAFTVGGRVLTPDAVYTPKSAPDRGAFEYIDDMWNRGKIDEIARVLPLGITLVRKEGA